MNANPFIGISIPTFEFGGFIAEELHLIQHHDIKYRLGRDTESEQE